MSLLWNRKTGVVRRESCMFAGTDSVRLLFPASELLRIACPALGTEYQSGCDCSLSPDGRTLKLEPGSRIPHLTERELHPAEPEARFYPAPDANAIEGGIDGRNLLFDRRNFFARHQIEVDYRSDEIDFRSELAPQRDRLPRCRARLARRERLNITVIGDSISEGYNATAFVGSPPFEPPYPELVRRELAERFGTTVELRNRAIGGTGCRQAADIADSWLGDRPDLLIVAYGMNDFAHLSATEFIRIMAEIRERCRRTSPDTEYLFVASMSGNPQWRLTPPGPDAEYAAALREFVAGSPGDTALADVHKVWSRILERKSFYDLTGNGVNHPNDYGHRIYASVLVALFDPAEGSF